ncbi:MAG: VanZ family protein [Cyanobacteria bacterium P01_F01_bin.150]
MKKKTVAIAFVTGIGIISVLATVKPKIFSFLQHIPAGDKLGHFFLFGIAALAVSSALPGPRSAIWGGLLVALLVLIEEYMQLFFTTRSFSYLDLLASLLGVLIFSIYYYVRSPRKVT